MENNKPEVVKLEAEAQNIKPKKVIMFSEDYVLGYLFGIGISSIGWWWVYSIKSNLPMFLGFGCLVLYYYIQYKRGNLKK